MTLLKTETFKPLSPMPAARSPEEHRVTAVADTNEARPFRSLAECPPAASTIVSPEQRACEPRVYLERNGERITHIRVHCTCGQVLELACSYDEPPSKP